MGLFYNSTPIFCPIYNDLPLNRVFYDDIKVYDMATSLYWEYSLVMSGVAGSAIFSISGNPNGPSFSVVGGQLLMLRDIPILHMSGTIRALSIDDGNGSASVYAYRTGSSNSSILLGSAGSPNKRFDVTSSLSGSFSNLKKGDKVYIQGRCSIANRLYNEPHITFTSAYT